MLGYLWAEQASGLIPHMLGISAASFIYVAAVDLIPSLHRDTNRSTSIQQLVLLVAGMGTIGVIGAG